MLIKKNMACYHNKPYQNQSIIPKKQTRIFTMQRYNNLLNLAIKIMLIFNIKITKN